MREVSARSVLRPLPLCAVVVAVLLLTNPFDVVWVELDMLHDNEMDRMMWASVVLWGIGPVLGGVLAGIIVSREDKKHYQPFAEGGLATLGGLVCGIAIWSLAGAYAVGLGAGFISFFTGVMFLIVGGPVGFLVGGFTAETLVWGRL